jgi:hypothetical protein
MHQTNHYHNHHNIIAFLKHRIEQFNKVTLEVMVVEFNPHMKKRGRKFEAYLVIIPHMVAPKSKLRYWFP